MNAMGRSKQFTVPCRIEVQHTNEHFHVDFELEGNPDLYPGDKVRIGGDPVMVGFGETTTLHRRATVTRAGPILRAWTRFKANLELTELYEVSFTAGRPL